MSWSPIHLRGISFISPIKQPAVLEFRNGLNVICGASDTGKSFIVEAIDFLLGSSSPLRDIPERVGYDRARLAIQTAREESLTLERSTGGGNFTLFEDISLVGTPRGGGRTLRVNPAGTGESLSNFLLSRIGLADRYLQKNQRGDTVKLGFRSLVKIVVIKEEDIIKRSSPLLSGQLIFQTPEYSMFKLLLTGVDASGLKANTEQLSEVEVSNRTNAAKAEVITELATEIRSEIGDIDRANLENSLSDLQADLREQQYSLSLMQEALEERVERRRVLMEQLSTLVGRIREIEGLLARFDLLRTHYQVDLARLAAIQESGSLLIHLDQKPCPLCGALPHNQHQVEQCDGDIEAVIRAATAEIAKVNRLSEELNQTIADLQDEAEGLNTDKAQILPEFEFIDHEIQRLANPLTIAQNTFTNVVKQSVEYERAIEKFERLEDLERRRNTLLAAVATTQLQPSSAETDRSQVDLSAWTLDAFAQKVQHLLQDWNFPGSERVHFDEAAKDIVIGGQPRTSRGKGYRAITHAAMTIGLMEFCKENALPHPGFVVLDSPLLAYYEPESAEDSLVGSDLKIRFYEYLANNHRDAQVIIVENEHPPAELNQRIVMTDFTKNPSEGRYGFFPIP